MTPTGLGLLTLRIFGKVFQHGNKALITGPDSPDRLAQAALDARLANPAAGKTRSGRPDDFDCDGAGNGGVTGQNMLPAWFAYLGLRQN
jgi:hypothetical protein